MADRVRIGYVATLETDAPYYPGDLGLLPPLKAGKHHGMGNPFAVFLMNFRHSMEYASVLFTFTPEVHEQGIPNYTDITGAIGLYFDHPFPVRQLDNIVVYWVGNWLIARVRTDTLGLRSNPWGQGSFNLFYKKHYKSSQQGVLFGHIIDNTIQLYEHIMNYPLPDLLAEAFIKKPTDGALSSPELMHALAEGDMMYLAPTLSSIEIYASVEKNGVIPLVVLRKEHIRMLRECMGVTKVYVSLMCSHFPVSIRTVHGEDPYKQDGGALGRVRSLQTLAAAAVKSKTADFPPHLWPLFVPQDEPYLGVPLVGEYCREEQPRKLNKSAVARLLSRWRIWDARELEAFVASAEQEDEKETES